MAVFLRATRVTTLLDDKAKAHLREADDSHRVPGYDSSGSEHDSPCLSGLVHAFLEHAHADSLSADVGAAAHPRYSSDDDLADDPDCTAATVVRELMDPAAEGDRFRVRLAADVYSVVEGLAGLRACCGAAGLRRAVMARLRASGYNAGICKARSDSSAGLNAGSYEYIDVVSAAAEFEVARATEAYKTVLAALPRAAVAGEETMRQVVRVVADAIRRSLRAQDLHIPPWRKSRYMIAKWLGPYRRTTNAVPASPGGSVSSSGAETSCRSVGFTTPAKGPATRTR
ncbi:plant-specific domain TIGR01615 family protein [Musa troglodytarum]|uniref:Plant-specific domain TIGR01615 family protein n=1 Tax=Musa troglodytarum TaxID=320322 RepID=A0A9E7GPX7_9LILI|nr:plant-specific domain TIGR01615 family protein [Musa troglodytarum]